MNLFKKMNKISLFLFSVCFLSLSLYTNVNADSSSYTTYHLHSTTSTTETTTDYNTSVNAPEMSNVMGGCYTEAVKHYHTGNSSSGGGCYTIRRTHTCSERERPADLPVTVHDGPCGNSWCNQTGYHTHGDYGHTHSSACQWDYWDTSCGYSQGQLLGYKASGCGKSNA